MNALRNNSSGKEKGTRRCARKEPGGANLKLRLGGDGWSRAGRSLDRPWDLGHPQLQARLLLLR